jgi:glucokinase
VGITATFGVDLGGSNLRVALVDPDGTIVEQRRAATPATLDGIVDTITGAVRAFAPLRPEARALGVGAAGMVDHDGVIHYSPNVPAFLKAPVRERLEAAVGLPTIVDNDANAAVVAELTHGAAYGEREVLLITLGTGLGGGIVTRGRVLRGAHGFGAEIGHFQIDPDGPLCACGQRGHWEASASGNALGAMGREWVAAGRAPAVLQLAGGDEAAVTGLHVGEAARAGDPAAIELIAEYAGHVAVGLVGLANILDPALIVVSGGLIDLADVLLDPVRAAFGGRLEGAAYRPEVPIVAAALGRHAGVIGAAVLARELS